MTETLNNSIAHWNRLAEEADQRADYEEGRGDANNAKVIRTNAEMYRRTAKSIELEKQTGKPHCACCLSARPGHQLRFGRNQ
jgi:hypothetical protein